MNTPFCANCHGSGSGEDGKACPFAPHPPVNSGLQRTKMQPGDDLHLTVLMAPFSLNLVVGEDRAALLNFGRAVWQAALKHADTAEQLSSLQESHEMLEWLEKHVLDVRKNLMYGSHRVFIYKPPFDEEGDPDGSPTLRSAIRSSMQAKGDANG